MHYELFMSAALAEARAASRRGERPGGAVAVLDEAMVASGQEEVVASGDPTAHAVVVTVREAARRLGRESLGGVTVFSAVEPCAMCVGALLESNVDGLVYSLPDPVGGAAGSVIQLADREGFERRLDVVSGILQSEAADIREMLGNGRRATSTGARPRAAAVRGRG
jgi:tRNA(adenine34) deaminase